MAMTGLLICGACCRFPLGEVIAQVEQPDPLVMRDVVPSDTAGVDSSCAVVLGHLCGPAERRNSRGKRKERRRGGPVGKNKISVLSDWMVLIFCK